MKKLSSLRPNDLMEWEIFLLFIVFVVVVLEGSIKFGIGILVPSIGLVRHDPFIIPNLIEAEDLSIVGRTGDFSHQIQVTSNWGAQFASRDSHVFFSGTKLGNCVEFFFPSQKEGDYQLFLYFSAAMDYGIFQIYVNGEKAKKTVDLYSETLRPLGSLPIGKFRLKSGQNRLKLEIVGHNPKSRVPYFQMGFDGIKLEPAYE